MSNGLVIVRLFHHSHQRIGARSVQSAEQFLRDFVLSSPVRLARRVRKQGHQTALLLSRQRFRRRDGGRYRGGDAGSRGDQRFRGHGVLRERGWKKGEGRGRILVPGRSLHGNRRILDVRGRRLVRTDRRIIVEVGRVPVFNQSFSTVRDAELRPRGHRRLEIRLQVVVDPLRIDEHGRLPQTGDGR